jgi:hypothetical protein
MGDLLAEVLNYKRNKHLFTPLERKKIKAAIRKKLEMGRDAFMDAVDDLNRID